tara:strand:- start:1826 stop:2281 length:456 start_codon:yes stop_codon:yes gene_type:complete
MIFNVTKLFTLVFAFDLYYKALVLTDLRINYILLIIAIVGSTFGSTTQLTHLGLKNIELKKKIPIAQVLAIYSSGLFIGYFSYIAGSYYNDPHITAFSSAIFSYISIEFIIAVKDMVMYFIKGITKKLPDAVISYFINNRNNNNNDNNKES